MPQVSLSGSINYQVSGSPVTTDIVAVGSYAASSIGTVDVPSGALSGASFAIPLGGVNSPVQAFLKNSVGTAVRLKTQSNPTGTVIPDGGWWALASTSTPGSNPLAAIEVDLLQAQTNTGILTYLIFGD